MEGFITFIEQYAVFPIAAICFGIGYVIKHYISVIPNKFIPLIMACIGLILNLVFNQFAFTPEVIITGIASGLVSTGSFEAVRNLLNKDKNNNTEKIENTEKTE